MDQLISNALKFCVRQGEVTVRWAEEDGFLFLHVANSADRVNQAVIDRAFEPWYRSRWAVSQHKPGAGLGLVIARGLARMMGGDLELRLENPTPSELMDQERPLIARAEEQTPGPVVHAELRLPLSTVSRRPA